MTAIPALIALACAIISLFVGAGWGLLLAILAIVLGVVTMVLAILPGIRGGIISIVAVVLGAAGVVVAIIKLFL